MSCRFKESLGSVHDVEVVVDDENICHLGVMNCVIPEEQRKVRAVLLGTALKRRPA
jgi:hypothetical protein